MTVAPPWERLVAAATLGTSRSAPSLPPGGELGEILAAAGAGDAETALLDAAAAMALLRRVGRRPVAAPLTRFEPVPADDATSPPLPPRAGRFLLAMLEGTEPQALPEFLAAAADAGFRIPAAHLPAALAFGAANRSHRAALRCLLGARGGWLATLHPDWSYAVGAEVDAPEQLDSLWEITSGAARLEILRQVRATRPELGRTLLETTWQSEAADERAELIAELATGLGPGDEPFLELALDDRSKRVRSRAAVLLPASQAPHWAARMLARVTPLLTLAQGKTGLVARLSGASRPKLEVTLPDPGDASMLRDGIEPKPPASERLAARSRWRAQVVRDRRAVAVPEGRMGPGPAKVPEEAALPRPAVERGELRERRLSWAELMRRVFEVDVLQCPGCGGRRQLIAVIMQPEVIVAFLESLGLPTRAPPLAPAREVDPDEASLLF